MLSGSPIMMDERHARDASMLRTRDGRMALEGDPPPGLPAASTGASAKSETSSCTSAGNTRGEEG